MTDATQRPDSTPSAVVRPLHSATASVTDMDAVVRQTFADDPRKGLEMLYRLYYQPLCSHALRFVYTKEVAEDIVGEVFYQLWKTNAYTNIQYTFRTYLYAAVRNRAYNHLRDELRHNRTPEPLGDLTELGQPETPQTLIEYDETLRRIQGVIQALPPQCQRVFLMSRFENKKHQEIADELGLALKTVEAHMTRALTQLRRLFTVLIGALLMLS